jgi:hypothetical protein
MGRLGALKTEPTSRPRYRLLSDAVYAINAVVRKHGATRVQAATRVEVEEQTPRTVIALRGLRD